MDRKKLNELIDRYHENNSEDVKNEIILNSKAIIDTLIKKHNETKLDKEELYAILSLELIKRVNRYLEKDFNIDYYSYIYNKLEGIIKVVKKTCDIINIKKINELINRYYEDNSEDVKNEIILNSMVIIDMLIKKHNETKLDKEELYAILSLGLVERVNSYLENDFRKNYYFYIYYELERIINKEEKANIKLESLDSLTRYYVKMADEIDDRIDLEEEIKLVLDCLNERYRNIIKMHYGIGYQESNSLREISKLEKTSYQSISELERKQLKLIRKLLELKRNNPEEFEKLHQEKIKCQNKRQELSDNMKQIYLNNSKIKELLKEYENTKNKRIKQEIFELDKNRIHKLTLKYKYEDTSLDEAYALICKIYYNFIDTFIELSKTNANVDYFTFTDILIRDKVRELSNHYMYNKNMNKLLSLYSRANDDNAKEQILEKIIEISEPKINNIMQKYAYLNIPYDDLRNIIVENIKFSIKNYLGKINVFNNLGARIKRNINKYLRNKENERSLKL